MKKLILIFIIIGIYSLCQAKPWQDYDVYTNPADGDHFLINDISETGPPDNNAEGTLKRLAWLYVQPRDSDLTSLAAIAFSANMLSFLDAADYAEMRSLMAVLPLAGGTLTGDVDLDDGATDSPGLSWTDATNEFAQIYKIDGGALKLWTTKATDLDFTMVGEGTGRINLLIDGILSEGGISLVAKYQGLDANLTAIADAEAGVAHPCVSLYDSGAAGQAGSDLLVAQVCGQWQSGAEASQIANLEFYAATTTSPGAPSLVGKFDSANDVWDLDYPVTAPAIDAGRNVVSITATLDLSASAICEKAIFLGSVGGAVDVDLATSGLCGDTGEGRLFYFVNNDDASLLNIDPYDTDQILLDGASCTAGKAVEIGPGEWAIIVGTAANYWQVIAFDAGVECET